MKRSGRLGAVIIAISLAMVAAACGKSSSTSTPSSEGQNETGKPVVGGNLIDYQNFSASDVPHIDPALAEEIEGSQISLLLFDGLADYDYKTGDLKPAVAESWSSNADASVWTFKLRKDVKWSDGSPVLPSDFKYAWERLASKQLASITSFHVTDTLRIKGAADVAKGTATEMSGLKADDTAMTLTMELEAPLSFAPAVTAHAALSPVPKKIVSALPDASKWEQGPMVSDGPFKLAERKVDQYTKIVRNDQYYGGIHNHKAYLDSIEFRVSKDQDSAWAAFEAGQGQTGRIPPARFADAKAKYQGRNSTDTAVNGIYYYVFNDKDPVVGGAANVKLRQAISLTIDRDRIARDIFSGSRKAATGVAMPGIPGFKAGLAKYSTRDVNRAKQLVAEWEKDNNKKVADLPVIKLNFGQGAGHAEIATIIQANLQEIGVKSDLDPREAKTYFAQMRAGQGQFLRAGWIADYNVYDNQLFPILHSSQIGGSGSNHAQWSNAKFDSLIDQGRRATDQAKSNQAYQDAEAVALNDDTIIVPIVWYAGAVAWSDQLHNVVQAALQFVNYDDMWLSK